MSLDISVIVCAHNPRAVYLDRVLNALKLQTLPMEQWKLLLIDNASTQPLGQRIDLSWHLNASHVHLPYIVRLADVNSTVARRDD
jgi:hypothetical protein